MTANNDEENDKSANTKYAKQIGGIAQDRLDTEESDNEKSKYAVNSLSYSNRVNKSGKSNSNAMNSSCHSTNTLKTEVTTSGAFAKGIIYEVISEEDESDYHENQGKGFTGSINGNLVV